MSLRKHFDKELLHLHQDVLKMGMLVEKAIRLALDALANADDALANQVIRDDMHIDKMEIDIEDSCIHLIAREQPIAGDLRTVITTLKIVSHLERMGDHGVHLAKCALRNIECKQTIPLKSVLEMGQILLNMIPGILTAFMNKDKESVTQIAKEDEKIDNMHAQFIKTLLALMKENPGCVEQATNMLFISRFMERLGDHAVDICEWVVYNITCEHPDLKS